MRSVVDQGSTETRKLVLELLARVVQKTPVRTGNAQANWQVAIGKNDTSEIEYEGGASGAEGKALTAGLKEIARIKLGDTIYVVNNAPYIGVLENGSSEQAPGGMVEVSIHELRTFFK